MEFGHPIG